MGMKKTPFGVKAAKKTDAKSVVAEVAIFSEKGLPMLSPNGKVWIISVDDTGNITATEVV